jgi:SRSO17 transposase
MIARAIAASVPFKWVADDTVYGVGDIEQQLRRAGKGYVLGVNSAHVFRSSGKRPSGAGTVADIARTRRSSDWKRLSAGAGTKGPRLCAASKSAVRTMASPTLLTPPSRSVSPD